MFKLALIALLSTALANPVPQVTSSPLAPVTATRAIATSAVASSASSPGPWSQVPFGVKYNDTEGGKRIHPFLREDLCVAVVNTTLFAGAQVDVRACLNNTAPLPAQRNLFNLTTLNVTSTYTGLIAPANQTALCLSGDYHIPANKTDYATSEDRIISLQACNATDPKQIWRYGPDDRVLNGTDKAFKLSLLNQSQCASILRVANRQNTPLVYRMLPCVSNAPSQLLVVVNGTSTPRERIPSIRYTF